jgi:serine/threonine-protein kinase RIO1
LESQTVQNLLIDFYQSLKTQHTKHYSLLYGSVRSLARHFNEKQKVAELQEIFDNCAGVGFALPKIEKVVWRDLSMGMPLHKLYNYRFKQKNLSLGDLIFHLDTAEIKMRDIFEDICKKHDIPQTFNLALLDAKGDMGMPRLK